jgi:hypothetical protein
LNFSKKKFSTFENKKIPAMKNRTADLEKIEIKKLFTQYSLEAFCQITNNDTETTTNIKNKIAYAANGEKSLIVDILDKSDGCGDLLMKL